MKMAIANMFMARSFLYLPTVYERRLRKQIRRTTNLWIGESAYAEA
jgi:hypothetical protein